MLLDFNVIITRLVCAVILHLQIAGEVSQAIKLMKFTIYRTASWNRRGPQFFVAFMQLSGALLTEFLNIFLMCKQSVPGDIIMNLLAFAVIAEIDDFYARSLTNHFGRELVDEGVLTFSKIGRDDADDPLQINQAWFSWVCQKIYGFWQGFYDSFYFYFGPYVVVALTFIVL